MVLIIGPFTEAFDLIGHVAVVVFNVLVRCWNIFLFLDHFFCKSHPSFLQETALVWQYLGPVEL